MFLTFAQRASLHPYFSRYTYCEDLVSDAVVTLCNAAMKFDLRRKNAFAYFQTVTRFALGRALKREYRHWKHRGTDQYDREFLIDVSATCAVSAAF